MSDISIGRSGRTRSLIIGTLFICMGTAGLIGLESLPGVDVLYAPTGVATDSAPDATTGQPLASVDRGKTNENGSARNSSEATPKTEPQTDVSASQTNSEETETSENDVDSVEVATLDWEPLSLDRSAKATEERLYQSVVYLASDELEGRGVRTRGLELAAQYIAEEYRNANLNVHHYADGPFHEFDLFSSSRKGYVQNMRLSAEVFQSDSLIRGADFTALMSSPQGRFSHSIAFAGYGISANEIGYDDYANLDVRGKAVIVLRHEPRRVAPVGDRTKREHSVHAYVHTKIENAIRHQAAAVILCTDHAWVRDAESADQLPSDNETAEPKESLLQTEIEDGDIPNGIPVVHVRREIVEQLVQDSLGTTLGELESTINSTGQPHSCELPHAEISGNVELVRSHKRLKNVVATLPAQGPRSEETIVIGAHYDHLGRDSWGSLSLNPNGAIHNGA
ncbi:MAG: hypothetical protein KDA80_19670, partial [Planctomycetaceae bacterium]|nr:hypothetical protein [Planctomycetaceae bacterium]